MGQKWTSQKSRNCKEKTKDDSIKGRDWEGGKRGRTVERAETDREERHRRKLPTKNDQTRFPHFKLRLSKFHGETWELCAVTLMQLEQEWNANIFTEHFSLFHLFFHFFMHTQLDHLSMQLIAEWQLWYIDDYKFFEGHIINTTIICRNNDEITSIFMRKVWKFSRECMSRIIDLKIICLSAHVWISL